jgi:alpha-ribazole phosphatase
MVYRYKSSSAEETLSFSTKNPGLLPETSTRKEPIEPEGAIKISTRQSSVEQSGRRLWLVRHGLTDWNVQQRFCGHSDISLTVRGQEQAQWIAEQLLKESISAIYTSDLMRARETAEIIAGQRTSAVQIKESVAWREMDFGEWEGLTYTQIVEQYKGHIKFFTDPEHHSPPNGESLSHMQQRVKDALSAIVQNDELLVAGDVVIVSHGGPLRILLCCILGMPLQRQWQLQLDPGSLSAIDLLPDYGSSEPRAILTLLNVQIPTSAVLAAKNSFSSGAT